MRTLKKWMILCLFAISIFVANAASAGCSVVVCVKDTECDTLVWWEGLKIRVECNWEAGGYPLIAEFTVNCDTTVVDYDWCVATHGIRMYAYSPMCSPSPLTDVQEISVQEWLDCYNSSGTIVKNLCLVPDDINCL